MSEPVKTSHKLLPIYERAREVLKEKGWTQRENARDPEGKPVSFLHETAACFCAAGALGRAENEIGFYFGEMTTHTPLLDVIRASGTSGECHGIPYWNDAPGRTLEEVLSYFDKAIDKLAKSRE